MLTPSITEVQLDTMTLDTMTMTPDTTTTMNHMKRNAILGMAAAALLAGAAWADDNGVIKGTVKFEGTPPKAKDFLKRMGNEISCKGHHEKAGGKVPDPTVTVNGNGTLRNVIVHVKSGLPAKEWPVPTEPVKLDQIGCMYNPHVFTASVGQPVHIFNSDEGVLHNIHSFSEKSNSFNKGMPGVKGLKIEERFKDDELPLKIKCDVHSWMVSYAGVFKHPFHTATGEDGSFTLKGLPAGEYEVEAWHEKYGAKVEKVKVGAGESKDVAFTYSEGAAAPAEGAPSASPSAQ